MDIGHINCVSFYSPIHIKYRLCFHSYTIVYISCLFHLCCCLSSVENFIVCSLLDSIQLSKCTDGNYLYYQIYLLNCMKKKSMIQRPYANICYINVLGWNSHHRPWQLYSSNFYGTFDQNYCFLILLLDFIGVAFYGITLKDLLWISIRLLSVQSLLFHWFNCEWLEEDLQI